jgi:hypothetical protein
VEISGGLTIRASISPGRLEAYRYSSRVRALFWTAGVCSPKEPRSCHGTDEEHSLTAT